MTTRKLVNLMMRSSDTNPYTGKLSEKDNILAAIELAKLAKEFADKGQTAEAMDVPSSQWIEVIGKLKNMQLLPSYYNRYIKQDKEFNKEHFNNWLENELAV